MHTSPAPPWPERLRRLWQPRQLLFWMMLGFNVLSSVLGWLLRTLPLSTTGQLLLGVMALGNVLCGLLAAWRLMETPVPQPAANHPAQPSS